MKHNPHALINVQALSEPQRAKHRRKVYSCYKAVIDKTPDQLKSDFAPWSSKAIREYVRRAYGMSISRRTARRYMQKMGFTCQCPVKAAREQKQRREAIPRSGARLSLPCRQTGRSGAT